MQRIFQIKKFVFKGLKFFLQKTNVKICEKQISKLNMKKIDSKKPSFMKIFGALQSVKDFQDLEKKFKILSINTEKIHFSKLFIYLKKTQDI